MHAGQQVYPVAGKMEKHMELYSALQQLDAVEQRLRDFVDSVAGHTTPACAETKAQYSPSLSEILATAPETLHRLVSAIHADIDELKALLY